MPAILASRTFLFLENTNYALRGSDINKKTHRLLLKCQTGMVWVTTRQLCLAHWIKTSGISSLKLMIRFWAALQLLPPSLYCKWVSIEKYSMLIEILLRPEAQR